MVSTNFSLLNVAFRTLVKAKDNFDIITSLDRIEGSRLLFVIFAIQCHQIVHVKRMIDLAIQNINIFGLGAR